MTELTNNQIEKSRINRTLIIGLGLIGGSLALALRKNGQYGQIIGFDTDAVTIEKALRRGVIDKEADKLQSIVPQVDLIILAVPVKVMETVLKSIVPHIQQHTLITDTGSTKYNLVAAAQKLFKVIPENFIPGHPIAGIEKSGIDAIDEHLFAKHKVILTPLAKSSQHAVNLLTQMWQSVGSQVLIMDVEKHDEVLAATSHLPHILAFSLVDTLAQEQDNNTDIFRYAAGGFRDFTRIAGSDPIMWHDVCLANKDALLNQLDKFSTGLEKLREAIDTGNSETLLGTFTRARVAREHFSRIISGTAYSKTMKNKNLNLISQSGNSITGSIRVAGDKSISHRAIIMGALAEGITKITGFLEGEDSLATVQVFRDMGVVIEGPEAGIVKVHGVGLNGLKQPPNALYLGNSGTSMRLLSGLLAGQSFDTELCGDVYLSKRPMSRVADPLCAMGAKITTAEQGLPPLQIAGGMKLRGCHYSMPIASAQVKSCLLLAGLYAEGKTSITEPAPTRDHTERMLAGFGYQVQKQGSTVSLVSGGKLHATSVDVPADISSAAFFMVAAAITPNSNLTLEHVGINPTRIGVINILRLMGADITSSNEREIGGEPVADISIRYRPLKAIQVPEEQVALAIDEFPVLFIAAACAEGTTIISGAGELRVKESDRIQSMVDGLTTLGIKIKGTADGALIEGGVINGGEVDSYGDHRIAMAFCVAALKARSAVKIKNCANVATSFPDFVELANSVGLNIKEERHYA